VSRARLGLAAGAAAVALAFASAAGAATLRVINRDGPAEGFNDPTPAAPVGGNPGTTRGAQRLIAFEYAADLWGRRLASPVEIRISATFDPLPCNGNSVTLGTAGPVSVFRDFAGAPLANTYYSAALADALAGMDLAPNEDDIEATFNSAFGTTCPFPAGWYYGLDLAAGSEDSDFVTVVLHELAHGLGFLTLVDVETGARFDGRDDIFMHLLVDAGTEKGFSEMTNAERRSAIEDTGFVRWSGAQVASQSGSVVVGADELGRVEIYAPPFAQPGSSVSHWSDAVEPFELLAPFFRGPLHDPGLAVAAFADIGWRVPSGPACAADCSGDGTVTIDELVLAVRIALDELGASACPAADRDGNGTVGIDDLVAAVAAALDGCAAT